MSVELNFDFTTPADYTYDSDKIEVVGGKAQLKLCDFISQQFVQDFANDVGFTYDSAKAEFVAGVVRQKDMRCPNATFCANYNTNINGNWGNGTLTGTPVGGASVLGGKLDLAHNDIRYVSYNPDGSKINEQVGCIKFKITPNYSGNPASSRTFFSVANFPSSTNYITVMHHSGGTIYLYIYDKFNVQIVGVSLGVWNPTISTEYEFELNYDITAGATRLFIDGIQQGATQVGVGVRDSTITEIRVGTENSASHISDFKIDDFVVFSTVQHTANYVPGYTVSDYVYVTSLVTLPQFSYAGLGSIQEFTDLTNVETGTPHYIFDGKYWNGSIWIASDDSYAQSNTYAVAKANIVDLTAVDSIIVKIVFDDSNIMQSNTDNLILEYTGQLYDTANPIIKPNAQIYLDGLEGFVELVSGIGNVKYILYKDSVAYWWDGLAWSTSNGTYAESNTQAEIDTNKATFTIVKVRTQVDVFLNSDGSQQTYIDNLQILYNFAPPAPPVVNKCIVYGNISDILDSHFIEDFTIQLNKKVVIYNSVKIIVGDEITVTPDATGYFEVELIETDNMETGSYYVFTINEQDYYKYVPDEASKSFIDLLDVEPIVCP